jgi:hypothetical protein
MGHRAEFEQDLGSLPDVVNPQVERRAQKDNRLLEGQSGGCHLGRPHVVFDGSIDIAEGHRCGEMVRQPGQHGEGLARLERLPDA